jgi:hypothetical protein
MKVVQVVVAVGAEVALEEGAGLVGGAVARWAGRIVRVAVVDERLSLVAALPKTGGHAAR